jgi:dolichyl-phosphate beta-glucosyltransferase
MDRTVSIERGLAVPCYNEARRLDLGALARLVDRAPGLRLYAVNDGSTDATLELLQRLERDRPDRVTIVDLATNQGKAEAVRRGLTEALAGGCETVGFFDADLSTPVEEMLRLLECMCDQSCDVLLGSRVKLLGRQIERVAARHYLGRVFATAASLTLDLPVYDTQCGAKLFRRTPALEEALARPFLSRWVFEVELLSRVTRGPHAVPVDRIREEPLLVWRDVAGSKLTNRAKVRAAIDLARIAWRSRVGQL